jgi:hypothetical protein
VPEVSIGADTNQEHDERASLESGVGKQSESGERAFPTQGSPGTGEPCVVAEFKLNDA